MSDLANPALPRDYLAEIDALNETYKSILVLKFGDSIVQRS
jgi:hypothetical protein